MKYCTLAFFIPKRKMEVGQCKGDSRFVPYSLSHGLRLLRKIFSPFSYTTVSLVTKNNVKRFVVILVGFVVSSVS